MQNCFTRIALSAVALLLSTSLALAIDVPVKTPDVKGAPPRRLPTAPKKVPKVLSPMPSQLPRPRS